MSLVYIIIAAAGICATLGGGYLIYRRLKSSRHGSIGSVLTLREIASMAAIEEETANREEQFIKQGQTILEYMQEFDQSYKRWEHAREH